MPDFITFTGCFIALVVFLGLWFVLRSVCLLYEYKRGVVFTLGRTISTRDPGLTLIFPIVQSMRRSRRSISSRRPA
jgi:regulator of protease activity HflC (stomatin/prohibitin superfamily)